MKTVIFIELCNYKDYPLGGHLSFAKHLTMAMRGEIDIVGIETDPESPTGCWTKKIIQGFDYNFYNIKNVIPSFKKPIIPLRIQDFFSLKKRIKNILSTKNYELIIVQTPEVLFSLPKNVLPITCLIMPGVGNPLEISRYPFARLLSNLYDRYFYKRVKSIQYILPAADKEAIQHFINNSNNLIDSNKVFQFPTRFDASVFHPSNKDKARQQCAIINDSIVVVTTGRLNWFKGWKFLIDSFSYFHDKHPNSYLYFLGGGEDHEKITHYLDSIRLNKSVLLQGALCQSDVAIFLNAADLFVMGSFAEGWSTSLVEAVACSIPCVVTDFSSARDLVVDGENGFVVDNRDEQLFSSKMEQALHLNKDIILMHSKKAYNMSVQTMRDSLNEILLFE